MAVNIFHSKHLFHGDGGAMYIYKDWWSFFINRKEMAAEKRTRISKHETKNKN